MLRRNVKLGAMNFKGEYRKDVAKRHAIAEARAIGGQPGYSDQRRNRSAPFVPPKPKEFDMAYSSLALRA